MMDADERGIKPIYLETLLGPGLSLRRSCYWLDTKEVELPYLATYSSSPVARRNYSGHINPCFSNSGKLGLILFLIAENNLLKDDMLHLYYVQERWRLRAPAVDFVTADSPVLPASFLCFFFSPNFCHTPCSLPPRRIHLCCRLTPSSHKILPSVHVPSEHPSPLIRLPECSVIRVL